MDHFIHRIPLHFPIKLRNVHTSGYLSWRVHAGNKCKSSSTSLILFNTTASLESMHTKACQYLWRLESSLHTTDFLHLETTYQPTSIRVGSEIYLYPACESAATQPLLTEPIPSHRMVLVRAAAAAAAAPYSSSGGKVRGVEIVDPDVVDDKISLQWAVEMPNLGLGRDDDVSTDERLNVDIEIGRMKPVLHGDIIALRQVHYLCSVPKSVSSPPYMGSPMLDRSPPISLFPSHLDCNTSPPAAIETKQDRDDRSPLLHPVVAKEFACIGNATEHLWIIEKATKQDLVFHHARYRPCSHISSSSLDLSQTARRNPLNKVSIGIIFVQKRRRYSYFFSLSFI